MYLGEDERNWTYLDESAKKKIVDEFNRCLVTTLSIQEALGYGNRKDDKNNTSQRSEHRLEVEEVQYRPLDFYKKYSEQGSEKESANGGWTLYRFCCDISNDPDLKDGYEEKAYLFAVRSPEDNSRRSEEGEVEWTLLDWTSEPLHHLNKRAIDNMSKEDIRDYLVFFCSFLGSDEDDYAVTPFMIPSSSDDLSLNEVPDTLYEDASSRSLSTFTLVEKGGLNESDGHDPSDRANGDGDEHPFEIEEYNKSDDINESIERFFLDYLGKKITNPPFPKNASEDDEKTGRSIFEGVLVWYRNILFRCEFWVYRDGRVEMRNDKVVVDAESLSIPRWDVKKHRSLLPLLCQQSQIKQIFAHEFLGLIQRRPSSVESGTGHKTVLRGLRVNGDVEASCVFDEGIRLENVEFSGNVDFSDSVFESTLELIGCRFLERLILRNAVIKGALHIEESQCLGALTEKDPEKWKPTFDCRGLRVNGNFFTDRLMVFGGIRGQWARIGGAVCVRGLQVFKRLGAGDRKAVDFSHAIVEGPFDLRGQAPVTDSNTPGRQRRTIVDGDLVLRGTRAWHLDLRGVRVEGRVDIGSCEITGDMNLGIKELGVNSNQYWRVRANSLDVSRSRVELLNLSGARIKGPLNSSNIRLNGSFLARLTSFYRTRIDGRVDLSGSEVKGDVDFDGSEVKQGIRFITGSCGRLRLGAAPCKNKEKLSIQSAEIRSVLLMDLRIEAGIDAIGLRTRSSTRDIADEGKKLSDAEGFVVLGTCLGGGLRFWRQDAKEYYLLRFNDILGCENKKELESKINEIEENVGEIEAIIKGDLDLRGLQTGGTVNLGHCDVDRDIRLEGAKIGGKLRATELCHARGVYADLVRIEGNAELFGLSLDKSLFARDGRVEGCVLLPATNAWSCGGGATDSAIQGKVVLSGTQVSASLVIQRQGLASVNEEIDPIKGESDSNEREGDDRARINLSRCKIEQLCIFGFEEDNGEYTFGEVLFDLQAIQVGDWYFKKNAHVRELLRETFPFDAGNYVDIEHRLALIGDKPLADAIYRDMRKRQHQERVLKCDREKKCFVAPLREPVCEFRLGLRRLIGAIWKHFFNFMVVLAYYSRMVFSRHGTWPWLMAVWLFASTIPMTFVLYDSRNVELPLVKDREAKHPASYPFSDGRVYSLEDDWGIGKAIGLSLSYAVPFYGGSRPEVVRARLNGAICFFWEKRDRKRQSCPVYLPHWLSPSPHGLAMLISIIQFFLWIFVAANLPTIIRRRS